VLRVVGRHALVRQRVVSGTLIAVFTDQQLTVEDLRLLCAPWILHGSRIWVRGLVCVSISICILICRARIVLALIFTTFVRLGVSASILVFRGFVCFIGVCLILLPILARVVNCIVIIRISLRINLVLLLFLVCLFRAISCLCRLI